MAVSVILKLVKCDKCNNTPHVIDFAMGVSVQYDTHGMLHVLNENGNELAAFAREDIIGYQINPPAPASTQGPAAATKKRAN